MPLAGAEGIANRPPRKASEAALASTKSGVADTTHDPCLADPLRLGRVHLTVSTLDGSIAFYQRALGLQLHDRDGRVATMGAGGEGLLVLVE